MDIHYCTVCGRKLTEDDFQTKNAIMTPEKRVMCMKCYTGFSASAPETKSEDRTKRFAERDAEPSQSSPLFIYGVFIGVLMLLGLGAVWWTMKPKPPVVESVPLLAPAVPASTPAPPIKTPEELDKQADEELSTALNAPTDKRLFALEDFLKKYPEARVSGRARDELRKIKLQQEADTKGVLVLVSLAPGAESWSFVNGVEFGPSTGTYDRLGDGSAPNPYTLKLMGDFSKGGGYVSALGKFNSGVLALLAKMDPSKVTGLRFRARSKDTKGINFRLYDASGQDHLFRMGLAPDGEWHTIEIKKLEASSQHWGGANDGNIHWPIQTFAVLLERGNLVTPPLGTLEITQVELVLGPARP